MSTIIDLTTNHSFVENNGVTIEDNAGKFSGSKALYFDGNSYMHFPASAASISNFPACIEAWVKPEHASTTEAATSAFGIITKGRYRTGYNTFGLYWLFREYWRTSLAYTAADNTNAFTFQAKSATNQAGAGFTSTQFLSSTYTPQWYHIALTITEGNGKYYYKLYLNGSLAGSDDQNAYTSGGYTNLTSSDSYLTIGAYQSYTNGTYTSSNKFKGYMSDIRLTYGEIIYTENFDPPTQPHPKNY